MMKKRQTGKLFLFLFITTILLFKIPNFYLIPFGENPFLTSQSLARILTLCTFVYIWATHIKNGTAFINKKPDIFMALLILIFFIFQSLSIVSAINMLSFFNRYKDVFIGICSFFLFYHYSKNFTTIISVLVFSAGINIILGTILFVFTDYFVTFARFFFYQNYVKLLEANLARGRIYLPTFDEIIIPFLFLPGIGTILGHKTSKIYIFIGITFFSLASNIRSNVFMLFAGIIGSLVAFKKIAINKLLFSLVGIMIIGYLVNIIMVNAVGISFVDRVLFRSQFQDIDTIVARAGQIEESLSMSFENLFGVGLGNYYDNLNIEKSSLSLSEERRNEVRSANEYAHNIFALIAAESGLLSLAVFLIILIAFVRHDIYLVKEGNYKKLASALAFWVIFSWGLFNPPVSGSYQFLFWGLRGLAQ